MNTVNGYRKTKEGAYKPLSYQNGGYNALCTQVVSLVLLYGYSSLSFYPIQFSLSQYIYLLPWREGPTALITYSSTRNCLNLILEIYLDVTERIG